MYAIARIAGKQFRIEPEGRVKVPRLSAEVDSSYEITEILMTSDGGKVLVGTPLVEGITATAKVLSHGRDPKIIVFRKKRRKGFKVKKGHRQGFTLLQIENIGGVKARPVKEAKPAAEKKKAAPKKKAAAKPKAAPKPKPKAKPKAASKPKSAAKKKPARAEKRKGK